MVDIILLLMVIASASSLLVVSPRKLQRKALLALREYEDDGQDSEIPMNSWSGSHPLADAITGQIPFFTKEEL